MFLRRTSPFRLVSSSRLFTTVSSRSFQIRKVGVEVEKLIKNKEEYDAIKKQQLERDVKKYGLKNLQKMAIDAHKAEQKQKQEKREPPVPVKFSHPLMVIDVANLMKHIYGSKYFSHPFAAKDLHTDLRKAATRGGARPQHIAVEAPESEARPKFEIVLVLEKLFRTGSFEGTVGNDDMWIRTVHAPDTRDINQNAGDDAIALVAERARAEDREVTLVSDDKNLGLRVARMGGRLLEGKYFVQVLKPDEAVQTDSYEIKASLWTRLREVVERETSTAEAVRELEEQRGAYVPTDAANSGLYTSSLAYRDRDTSARVGSSKTDFHPRKDPESAMKSNRSTSGISRGPQHAMPPTTKAFDSFGKQRDMTKTKNKANQDRGGRSSINNLDRLPAGQKRDLPRHRDSSTQKKPTHQPPSTDPDTRRPIRPTRLRRLERRRLEREQKASDSVSAGSRKNAVAR